MNLTYDGTLLTKSSLSSVLERYGHPMGGIPRSFLNRFLKDAISSVGIPVISEFKVSAIVEEEDQVTVVAEDGRREEGSFVIGCDGLNFVVRASILKSNNKPVELVEFTGIVQHRGISPTPPSMLDHLNTIMFIYGPSYFTYYPITFNSCLWALYQRPKVGTVEWPENRFLTPEVKEARMKELLEDLKDWPKAFKDTVGNSVDITYLKVLDRKVLEQEQGYSAKGRCVLLGDAAHPFTPHSGHGANQALEDAWHLAQILPSFEPTTPPATPPSVNPMSSSELKPFFEAFAQKRQPRTAAIMKISRDVGDLKCPMSPEEIKRRDEYFKETGFIAGSVPTIQDDWFSQPFQ